MTDRKIVLIVAVGLLVVVLSGIAGVIVLTLASKDVPDVLSNIATTGLGALAALLVSTRSAGEPSPNTLDQPAVPVEVVNP